MFYGYVGYAVVATAASLWYGWYAVSIFVDVKTAARLSLVRRVHEFWFNFVGSLTGWSALADLLFVRVAPI
jgi:hypothetical protein